jgi:hypothetical protein
MAPLKCWQAPNRSLGKARRKKPAAYQLVANPKLIRGFG